MRALLDTSVLWPSLQRDFLLSMAIEGAYQPLWSNEILVELSRTECKKLQLRGHTSSMAMSRAHGLVNRLRLAFPDAEVQLASRSETHFGLPDANDEHVLAAAQAGGASVLVTSNLKDFPQALMPVTIEVLTPSEFVEIIVSGNQSAAVAALRVMANRRANPHQNVDQLLAILDHRYGMTRAVQLIQDWDGQ